MNSERLGKLTDFLLTVPEKQFNLSNWASSGDLSEKNCNTVGCAGGWATVLFKKDGLELVDNDFTRIPYIKYKNYYGWAAIEYFFDIEYDDAEYLFCANSYNDRNKTTSKTVSERIKEFIRPLPLAMRNGKISERDVESLREAVKTPL